MSERDSIILELIEEGRLRVDAANGLVYATKSNTPGKPVGARTSKGYLRLCVNRGEARVMFMVHRVVWVSVNGPVPDGKEIDHINGTHADNRIANLEAVQGAENMRRATVRGVFQDCGRTDGIRDEKGRFGTKAAGRLLDGALHDSIPEAVHGPQA